MAFVTFFCRVDITREMYINHIFAGLTALCAQIAFSVPWTPVPYTLQTFAVLITGVYLRRNDTFLSGCVYLLAGAIGAPVFAEGGSQLFDSGKLIANGRFSAFPFSSALVAGF